LFAHGRIAGTFVQLSGDCGLRTDGTIDCAGGAPDRTIPEGQFVQLVADYNVICGLRADGSVTCSRSSNVPPLDPPAGSFVQVPGPTIAS
jgi:hypothetical protein